MSLSWKWMIHGESSNGWKRKQNIRESRVSEGEWRRNNQEYFYVMEKRVWQREKWEIIVELKWNDNYGNNEK